MLYIKIDNENFNYTQVFYLYLKILIDNNKRKYFLHKLHYYTYYY